MNDATFRHHAGALTVMPTAWSGAAHTTAHTVQLALITKTVPGISTVQHFPDVSADRVLAYGDGRSS